VTRETDKTGIQVSEMRFLRHVDEVKLIRQTTERIHKNICFELNNRGYYTDSIQRKKE
jgi:hypothetical protein